MDIYAAVTERIIEQMEQGIIPWQKPWISNGKAISHATGKPYSLLNQLMLGRPGEYLTFKQCQEAGGKVKKGEKASMVVFWKWIEQEDEETHEKKEVPSCDTTTSSTLTNAKASLPSTPRKPPSLTELIRWQPRKTSSMTTSPAKASSFLTKKATGPSTGLPPTKSSSPSASSS